MVKSQKGFHLLYILVFVAVVGVIGLVGSKVINANKSSGNHNASLSNFNSSPNSTNQGAGGPNYKALAACGSNKAVLTTVPVDTSKFFQILPLGNQGVPDHTLPTDHVYFAINDMSTPIALNSPGQIVVTNMTMSGETITGGNQRPNDYEITFAACKGVSFDFAHIESLSPALKAVAPSSTDSSCQHDSQAAGVQTFYCNKALDLVLQPGEPIGTVGGDPHIGAFDFGARDSSYKDPGYVDDKWHMDQTPVCALDYFTTSAKAQLYSLIKRKQAPLCGEVGQDKANTLQGGWFATNDYNNGFSQWNKQLSLIHNNIDASVGELAVGGTITNPSIYAFNPTRSGTINREPGETRVGVIYCYQSEPTDALDVSASPGKILMQLVNNNQMKAEHKSGACTSNESFNSPTTYYR